MTASPLIPSITASPKNIFALTTLQLPLTATTRLLGRLAKAPWKHPMKLLSISLGSWLLGLSALLLTFFLGEGATLNGANAKGVTLLSLVITALLFSLAYAPSLFWLRNRLGGCRP